MNSASSASLLLLARPPRPARRTEAEVIEPRSFLHGRRLARSQFDERLMLPCSERGRCVTNCDEMQRRGLQRLKRFDGVRNPPASRRGEGGGAGEKRERRRKAVRARLLSAHGFNPSGRESHDHRRDAEAGGSSGREHDEIGAGADDVEGPARGVQSSDRRLVKRSARRRNDKRKRSFPRSCAGARAEPAERRLPARGPIEFALGADDDRDVERLLTEGRREGIRWVRDHVESRTGARPPPAIGRGAASDGRRTRSSCRPEAFHTAPCGATPRPACRRAGERDACRIRSRPRRPGSVRTARPFRTAAPREVPRDA